ncbi:hypothetical protein SAICODRAFT_92990 [Saitoella complicata NRRL Y-17804]|uniref:uncharacterized protein n=1 Tax=Saitoella complicata (strain BCRC 22490 / CBS 7301 / JCM 7358 / NBRC 10748 / NRRL Y-17804) TaxID=698492 RepID=UPI00086737CE|nr:uncharacterized protein SAICODRAFT_92990 [Saitoella complicata NRRL Y-17804]ODQ52694.1 hypothetical protein SAICODRAFT_92990 [Saitoella complicata NRRL Y-17804]
MDPFGHADDLLNIRTAFHTGAYSTVIGSDLSSLTGSSRKLGELYIYRARLATGQDPASIAKEITTSDSASKAVKALAEYTAGATDKALKTIDALAASAADAADPTVQVVGATVLVRAERYEDALALLGNHENNLEAVALLTQLYLHLNRTDLAKREVEQAKKWADDSIIIQLADSWVNMRLGGNGYSQSFYLYEELSQTPSTRTALTLTALGVAHIHLSQLEEARAAFDAALEIDEKYEDALAGLAVCRALEGKGAEGVKGLKVGREWEEMGRVFDEAAGKYGVEA